MIFTLFKHLEMIWYQVAPKWHPPLNTAHLSVQHALPQPDALAVNTMPLSPHTHSDMPNVFSTQYEHQASIKKSWMAISRCNVLSTASWSTYRSPGTTAGSGVHALWNNNPVSDVNLNWCLAPQASSCHNKGIPCPLWDG